MRNIFNIDFYDYFCYDTGFCNMFPFQVSNYLLGSSWKSYHSSNIPHYLSITIPFYCPFRNTGLWILAKVFIQPDWALVFSYNQIEIMRSDVSTDPKNMSQLFLEHIMIWCGGKLTSDLGNRLVRICIRISIRSCKYIRNLLLHA